MPREASYRIEFFSGLTLGGRRHYFRIRATNGKIVAQSEGYRNRGDCEMTAGHLRASLIEARMFDVDSGEEIE